MLHCYHTLRISFCLVDCRLFFITYICFIREILRTFHFSPHSTPLTGSVSRTLTVLFISPPYVHSFVPSFASFILQCVLQFFLLHYVNILTSLARLCLYVPRYTSLITFVHWKPWLDANVKYLLGEVLFIRLRNSTAPTETIDWYQFITKPMTRISRTLFHGYVPLFKRHQMAEFFHVKLPLLSKLSTEYLSDGN